MFEWFIYNAMNCCFPSVEHKQTIQYLNFYPPPHPDLDDESKKNHHSE